ncbi:MAG: arginine N-succinyltransferase [Enterobacterales bacterium]|nr:arginine N-succinyltransferase [Enterobacterales bacterium]
MQTEGFSRSNYVDIFDAGPTIAAETQHIRSIQQSAGFQVNIGPNNSNGIGQNLIICNSKLSQSRAIQTEAIINDEQNMVTLTEQQANYLLVEQDDLVRLIAS